MTGSLGVRSAWLWRFAVAIAFSSAEPAFAQENGQGPATTVAPKQPSEAEMVAAKQHFDSGARFFQEGNYSAAQLEFRAAYELSKLPALLFNLGRTAEKQGQKEEALRYYDQYLTSNPSDAEDVKKQIAVLRESGSISALSPSVVLDGGPAWLKGHAKVPPIAAIAALSAGVVFLAIGIGTGAGALSTQTEVATAQNRYWTGDVANLVDKGNALNGTAIAFNVLGGVALAGGAAWTGYWLYLRSKKPNVVSAPTAKLLPTGNGLVLIGKF